MRNCEKSSQAVKDLFCLKKTRVAVNSRKSLSDESETSFDRPAKPAAKRPRMETWADTMNAKEKDVLDRAFADVFFTTGIPFRVAEAPSLIHFLQLLRPAYKPPSARRVSGTLLTEAYNEEYKRVETKIKKEFTKICVVSDGWSNCRNNHLVNFVVTVPGKKPIFLTAVDVGEEKQNAENIAEMIDKEVIRKFGIEKIGSIVTDNAPCNAKSLGNFRKALSRSRR